MPRREWLTISEVAARLRVDERTVRRWISRNLIPHRAIGGTYRIHHSAVAPADTITDEGASLSEEEWSDLVDKSGQSRTSPGNADA